MGLRERVSKTHDDLPSSSQDLEAKLKRSHLTGISQLHFLPAFLLDQEDEGDRRYRRRPVTLVIGR